VDSAFETDFVHEVDLQSAVPCVDIYFLFFFSVGWMWMEISLRMEATIVCRD